MMAWAEFIAALVVFQLSHMIPVRPPVRPWLVQTLGLRGYIVGYSLVSVALLVWLIVAAGRAPYIEVIPPYDLLRWVPLIIMPFVCLLGVMGLMAANPLSFGGLGQGAFNPDQPGILGVSRHPLLLAMLLWGLVHLLANGDLAHIILFGLFAGFSVLGMVAIDRRKQGQMGLSKWQSEARNTAWLSLRGVRFLRADIWGWLGSAGVFAALLLLHAPVIGLSPLP